MRGQALQHLLSLCSCAWPAHRSAAVLIHPQWPTSARPWVTRLLNPPRPHPSRNRAGTAATPGSATRATAGTGARSAAHRSLARRPSTPMASGPWGLGAHPPRTPTSPTASPRPARTQAAAGCCPRRRSRARPRLRTICPARRCRRTGARPRRRTTCARRRRTRTRTRARCPRRPPSCSPGTGTRRLRPAPRGTRSCSSCRSRSTPARPGLQPFPPRSPPCLRPPCPQRPSTSSPCTRRLHQRLRLRRRRCPPCWPPCSRTCQLLRLRPRPLLCLLRQRHCPARLRATSCFS